MAGNAGPPPVQRQQPNTDNRVSVATTNYLTIVETLKANNGAEAKAIRAMFGGDRQLMDRFLAMSFSLLQSNPKILLECDPMSLVQVIKDAASLGLVPMTEDAAVIPYGKTAKLMPMWRGYVKRIRNSREVVDLDVQMVYMNDQFELRLGTDPNLLHVPILVGERDVEGNRVAERGDYRGAYAWALMPSGKYIIEWMTADDLNYVRDTWGNKSKDSPWVTSWGEMARKTVIRRLAKRLPAAAVDKLLELDKASDEARDELVKLSATVSDGLAEVRQLALQAVGQLPAGDENPPENAAGNTNEEPTEPATQPPGQPDGAATEDEAAALPEEDPEPSRPPDPEPTVDPNVRAAMRLNEEQQQLERQRHRNRS